MDLDISLQKIREANFRDANLTELEWNAFADCLEEKQYVKHEFLTRAGELENYLYFMVDGVVRGYFINDGVEHVVGFSYDHNPSGSIDSFLSRKPTLFFTQALEDSQVVRIHHQDLQKLYDNFKNFEKWGRLLMEKFFLMKAYHEIAVLTYSAEERYQRLMRDSPRVFQLIPLKHLASYLGMSAETLSRLRKKESSRN